MFPPRLALTDPLPATSAVTDCLSIDCPDSSKRQHMSRLADKLTADIEQLKHVNLAIAAVSDWLWSFALKC